MTKKSITIPKETRLSFSDWLKESKQEIGFLEISERQNAIIEDLHSIARTIIRKIFDDSISYNITFGGCGDFGVKIEVNLTKNSKPLVNMFFICINEDDMISFNNYDHHMYFTRDDFFDIVTGLLVSPEFNHKLKWAVRLAPCE